MALNMMENGVKIKHKGKEFSLILKEIYMKDNGKIIMRMVKEF